MSPPRDRPSYRDLPAPVPSVAQLPDKVAELEGRVFQLEHVTRQLEEVIGCCASETSPGLGLVGCMERLEETIGRAPNAATGEPGSGLCGVLAELVERSGPMGRKMLAATAAGAAGAIGLVQALVEGLRAVGVLH